MKQATLIITLILGWTMLGQAQLQQQLGFDLGVGFHNIQHHTTSNISFEKKPDLTIGATGTLKYDLIIAQHFHIGVGFGLEGTQSTTEEINTTNLLLPVEIGYRSPAVGIVYFTGDLFFMPMATVWKAKPTYYPNAQGNGQDIQYLFLEYETFSFHTGVKFGIACPISKVLELQFNLLGRINIVPKVTNTSELHRDWGVLLNAGLRWNL
ncbi:MAG: outer membrane beta-barrel protein [Aureispira sp.]